MFRKVVNKWHVLPITMKVSTSYFICSVLQRGLSFITLPLFTRLLTTEQYGQATLYSSWGGLFAIFLTLNLAWGSFGTAMMKYEDRRDEYISSTQGIFLLLSAVFLSIYLPFKNVFNKLFQMPTFFVVLLVVEQIASNSVLLWSGKKRYEFRYKSVIALTLGTSVFCPLVAYFLVISSQEKGWARIFGNACVIIVSGLVVFIINLVRGKKLFNKEFWRYAFGFNIPLVPYYLSQMIFNQSDRIMISHYTGTGDAALYGVAYTLAMILTFVTGAINNSYIPWLYGKIKAGKQKENRSISSMLSLMMASLILVVIWFAPEIISILAGKQYAQVVRVVPPVAMSLLLTFYTGFATDIEFYYEEKWLLVFASIGAAVLNIILNALFIPRFGFVVAGYTTLVSYVVFALCNFIAMLHVLKKRGIKESGFNLKILALVFIGFAVLGFVASLLYEFRILRIAIASVGLVAMISQFKRALRLFKMLKNKNETEAENVISSIETESQKE